MSNNNPQKILADRYMFVCRSLILLINDGKVLLQKAAPTKKIWAGFYNGLGGHVESGEDVLSSASRELEEEAGIKCKDLHLCGIVAIDVEEKQGIMMFVFTGSKIDGELQGSAEGTLEWIRIDQIDELPIVEDVPFLVKMIQSDRRIFNGHYSYDQNGKLIPRFNYSID